VEAVNGSLRRRLGILRRALRRAARPAPAVLTEIHAPTSRVFGLDRGTPIDRYYIERFLAEHAERVRGRTLEVGEREYSLRFGAGRIERAEVLVFGGVAAEHEVAGDLTDPASLPGSRYDCFVCTQTFNFIYDVAAAIRGAHHVLKPGGVLLATVAGISPISRWDADRWGDFWRFTPQSLERQLRAAFTGEVQVRSFGNLLAATALLHGLAVEDLRDPAALATADADFPVVIAATAGRAS
jgi:SAM-dependent methyltransferase